MPKWRMQDLNLVKGAAKQRQGEDRLRADAWRKEREAELEAVVNRTYDGMEIPELRDLVNQASTVVAPIIAEFDRSAAQHYPAEFSRPRLGISLTPGGFPPKVRDKVRRDAAKHLAARHAYMLANSAGFTTEVVSDAIIRTTDNPEVVDVLEKLAVPNRATPSLQPPGPAIGILRTLLPHPEEWALTAMPMPVPRCCRRQCGPRWPPRTAAKTTMSDLPPGVTIGRPPPELRLNRDDDDYRYRWDEFHRDDQLELSAVLAARAFPEPLQADPLEVLRSTRLFACSGAVDSTRYREANKFRTLLDMGWEEARIALNRLVAPLPYGDGGKPADFAALAAFALTATAFQGFVGKKGEHAVKLRDELARAIGRLEDRLKFSLTEADHNTTCLARPLSQHGENMTSVGDAHAMRNVANAITRALWTVVPAARDDWVWVAHATPDEVMAALDYLRTTLMTWTSRRPDAVSVAERLQNLSELPTAGEYANALHIAEMLVFITEKLLSLYAGIMYSMPIYRLYPATSEEEAIELWWPWGHPAPLTDGAPPRPPKPRKQVLDPSLITATRPQDVVREVMEKTGINRTTAQRMTAPMRQEMRAMQYTHASQLLRSGKTKAEVARRVGLSPSRISALFPGKPSSDAALP